jgi:hypothetical protein
MSLYLGGEFVDYRFYVHFNPNSLTMAGGVKQQILWTVFCLTTIPIVLYWIAYFLQNATHFRKSVTVRMIKIAILFAAILILWLPERSMFHKLQEIYLFSGFSSTKNNDFEQNIAEFEQKHGILLPLITQNNTENIRKNQSNQRLKFTKKADLQAKFGGKNIIILSLESFERAMLQKPNSKFTPCLSSLKKQWNYYDMCQQSGSYWTAGSLYTVFTGMPCLFSSYTNELFYGTKSSKMITLGDVLQKCGYEMYHLSNTAKFAGTQDILKTFGVQNIIDENLGIENLRQMPIVGAYDKDIFTKAKEIIAQKSDNKPFMMWISTTQFHCPDGYIDETMLEISGKKSENLETVAAATDYLVGDFLKFLENEDFMKNTVVFIFPDHLFMGHKKIFSRTGFPRSLYLLTNAQKSDLQIDTTNFYQIDLLKNILSGAKIKHNAVFFSDFIKENKNEFIMNNLQDIKAINLSALNIENMVKNVKIYLKNKYLICKIDNEVIFVKDTAFSQNNPLVITFDNSLKLISQTVVNQDIIGYCQHSYLCIIVSYKNGKINLNEESVNGYQHTVNQANKISFNTKDFAKLVQNLPKFDVDWDIDYPKTNLEKYPQNMPEFFSEYLQKIIQDSAKIVLMSCFDEASVNFTSIFPILQKAGLKEDLSGKFRYSYFSVFSKNRVYCEKSAKNITLAKILNINDLPVYILSSGFESKPCGAKSIIAINSKNYSLSQRGLNVVIFDKKRNQVFDAFNVDFHADNTLKIKRE